MRRSPPCAGYSTWWSGSGWARLIEARLRRDESFTPIAPPGLILLGLTVNFAAIDAIMSLDPHFNSSAFGMINAAESGLFALSVTILATLLSRAGCSGSERDDLGRLLQSLLILWAYLDFMQLLIVWQSDLPKEAAWYLARSTGLWGVAGRTDRDGAFPAAVPGSADPALRRSRRGLIATTALLIVMAVVRGWWLVLPAARARHRLDRCRGGSGLRRHFNRPAAARARFHAGGSTHA